MDTRASGIDATEDLARAGFWRRGLAIAIDSIVVMLPFQILAAILFTATAGGIQMNSGFYSFCMPAKTIPQGLAPVPPQDSNFAQVCRTSFFGATTGATLNVGRTTRDGNATTTVSQSYMLDRDGKPIRATSIDAIFWLALLAYFIGMIWKTGKTLGCRVARVRVVGIAQPGVSGVPLRKVFIRYLAMAIGVMPAFAILIYQWVTVGGGADAMFNATFFQWIGYAMLFAAAWVIVLAMQMGMKKDPVYDRLAGTAVLRDQEPATRADLMASTSASS